MSKIIRITFDETTEILTITDVSCNCVITKLRDVESVGWGIDEEYNVVRLPRRLKHA